MKNGKEREIIIGAIILGYDPRICKKCNYLIENAGFAGVTQQYDKNINIAGECSWDMHKGEIKKYPILCINFCYLKAEEKKSIIKRINSAAPTLS